MMPSDPKKVDLSVVVPFYNEEENIARLHEALTGVLDDLEVVSEMLFVDDGSRDTTFEICKRLAECDDRVTAIKLRKNCGQTPAMVAGIEHARGEVIVTMDGDLQNDPRDIKHFLEGISEGYDLVVGWRFNRKDKLITRKIPSKIANWLIGKVTGVPIRDNGCSLKAYRAELIQNVPLYSEMHRFIPAMASLAGPKIKEIKVRHHARQFGESKYGLSRIYKVLIDLLVIKTLVSFTMRPLLWFILLSLPFALLAAATAAGTVLGMLATGTGLSVPVAGTGLLFGALAFFVFFGGVLGEFIFATGDIRPDQFSSLTAKVECRNAGE